MILPARRRLPRAVNYRIPGVWSGLGAFNPPARPVWVDPGYPADPAIVAANTAANDAYQVAMRQEQAGANFDQCALNAQNANSPEQYAEVMARCQQQAEIQGGAASPSRPIIVGGGPTLAPRGGQVTFTTSRGGTALQVGDTWLVSITGATPNAGVTVSGSGPGGSFVNTPMGSTDANGSYSKSGAVGTGEVGSWLEQWAVGGVPSGSFGFSVASAVTPAGKKVVQSPTGTPPAGGGTPAGGTPGGAPATPPANGGAVAGFDLSKVPWWGWLAGAGAAVFVFGGGRGR